jgi:hypothetical protein
VYGREFRDSKQFTGLLDCQARTASALDFHFNAALATLNLVRAEDLGMPQGQAPNRAMTLFTSLGLSADCRGLT